MYFAQILFIIESFVYFVNAVFDIFSIFSYGVETMYRFDAKFVDVDRNGGGME